MAACAQLLGFPRVALMFLTRGDMPHEQLWSDWFGDAAGQLPLQYVQVIVAVTGSGVHSLIHCSRVSLGRSAASFELEALVTDQSPLRHMLVKRKSHTC